MPAQTARATFSLLIPSASYAAAHGRKAQYVSPSTLSGTIRVDAFAPVELDLGAGSPLCTTATNGRTCLISAPAPIGTHSFALTLYDGPYSGGVHTGTAVSGASGFAATITEGSANTPVPVILGGVPSSYQLVVTSEPLAYQLSGASATGTAKLNVYDADSNLIVGSGGFVTAANIAVEFQIGASPANELFSVNGGANATFGTVSSSSDTIAFTQTAASIGAYLKVTPSVALTERAPAFVRPIGFTTANIESNDVAPSATVMQLTPAAGNSHGVAFAANTASAGVTDNAVGVASSCGFGGRFPDWGYSAGSYWYVSSTPTLWTVIPSCTNYSQGAVGPVETMTAYNDNATMFSTDENCLGTYFVAGVNFGFGSASPTCKYPHDAVNDGQNIFTVPYTSTADLNDHVAVYDSTTYASDVPMTYNAHTAGNEDLISAAPRADGYYVLEVNGSTGYLWFLAHRPGTLGVSIGNLLTLPSSYTYVKNTAFSGSVSYSNRTMAIGADGLLYLLVSAPYNGVVVIDPSTGSAVAAIPNVAAASSATPFNLTADARGSIYWSANGFLMHYPNGLP